MYIRKNVFSFQNLHTKTFFIAYGLFIFILFTLTLITIF